MLTPPAGGVAGGGLGDRDFARQQVPTAEHVVYPLSPGVFDMARGRVGRGRLRHAVPGSVEDGDGRGEEELASRVRLGEQPTCVCDTAVEGGHRRFRPGAQLLTGDE